MFPIGDDNHGARGIPVVTVALIVVNVLVYLYEASLDVRQQFSFIYTYGAIPAEIERGIDLYTLFTSMFVHGGFAHIAGNMLFLWIFGDNIEQRFGSALFLVFYLGTGLAASVAHILTSPASQIPTVGASGAISGVMGAYILLYPLNRIRTFIWYLGVVYVPAFIYLGVWFMTQLLNGMVALSVPTAQSTGVAFWAHVGGFVAGMAGAALLAPIKPEPPRRRQEILFPPPYNDRDEPWW
jgi:membrane associated rhomboid family serine protease